MTRTHAQRQKDYIKNKKKNDPKFNEKEAKRTREKRKENKLKATEYEAMKAKDRMRKQAKTQLNESSTSYSTVDLRADSHLARQLQELFEICRNKNRRAKYFHN